MTKEQAKERICFLAEVLAQAGLLQFLEEWDEPLRIGRSPAFPVIDTDEGRLQGANEERDAGLSYDASVDTYPIQGGLYYVAIPRATDDGNILRRAVELLNDCIANDPEQH